MTAGSTGQGERRQRILIVDDSAYARRALKNMVEEILAGVDFSYASSGDEALSQVLQEPPDLIFLDLEMPRMDGFTFLRLLMAQQPMPVIIVSSRDDRQSILKALELGALDFIAKPTRETSARIYEIKDLLEERLNLINAARFAPREPARSSRTGLLPRQAPSKPAPDVHVEPDRLICIGASTGGPGTISHILTELALKPTTSIVIAQHMPAGFTEAFAERLDRLLPYPVREVRHLDRIDAGSCYICPGGTNTVLSRTRDLRFRLVPPTEADRYLPSADLLFASAGEVFGRSTLGVVLTGMGDDGVLGARRVREAGGTCIAENPQSAIVNGMPRSVVEHGLADHVFDLSALAGALEQWSLGILKHHAEGIDG